MVREKMESILPRQERREIKMLNIILQLAGQLRLRTDLGLKHEIGHNLETQSNIEEFKIEENEEKYKIKIKLKAYSLIEAKKVFNSLVRFIQHNATFYAYEQDENTVNYVLISASEDKIGFSCEITFY